MSLAGHLLSTAEVESALAEHPAVAESAVVSRPHTVKGECIYCFVILKDGKKFTEVISEELKKQGKPKLYCFWCTYCLFCYLYPFYHPWIICFTLMSIQRSNFQNGTLWNPQLWFFVDQSCSGSHVTNLTVVWTLNNLFKAYSLQFVRRLDL